MGMSRVLRNAWVASIVACGTLIGHTVTYALEGRDLADGRHGYFAPILDVVLASALLACALLVGRVVSSYGIHRVRALPSLPRLWLVAAVLQVAGFVTLELLEGNAPDAVGCSVQIVVALLVAVSMTLFWRVVHRYAEALLISYARRTRSPARPASGLLSPVDAVRSLVVRAGVRRFKRPPPQVG